MVSGLPDYVVELVIVEIVCKLGLDVLSARLLPERGGGPGPHSAIVTLASEQEAMMERIRQSIRRCVVCCGTIAVAAQFDMLSCMWLCIRLHI